MDIEEIRTFLEEYGQYELNPNLRGADPPDYLIDRIPREHGENIIPLDEYDIQQKGSPTNIDDPGGLISPLDEVESKERIWTEAVETEGFETYAWYVPFHFSPQQYGIYIREEGLQLLGNLLFAWSQDSHKLRMASLNAEIATDTHPDDFQPFDNIADAITLALEIFRRHEAFHYQVELLSAYLEDAMNETCYVHYSRDIYQPTYPEETCLEETLANASVYRSQACINRAPSGDVFRLLFHLSTESQPPAYAAYETVLGNLYNHRGQLMKAVVEGEISYLEEDPRGYSDVLHIGKTMPVGRPLDGGAVPVPIYIVESKRVPDSLAYFQQIQLETDYDIQKTEDWETALENADETLRQYAQNLIPKLEKNVYHSGFEWEPCGGDLWYGRLNQQYRFVARRYDQDERIELVDFGPHDLPQEYGCY